MSAAAFPRAGQLSPMATTATTGRSRCVCGWWLSEDGRCVNRMCGEFQHAVEQDDDNTTEVGHD